MKPSAQNYVRPTNILLSVAVVASVAFSGCDMGTYSSRQSQSAQSYKPPVMKAQPADTEKMEMEDKGQ